MQIRYKLAMATLLVLITACSTGPNGKSQDTVPADTVPVLDSLTDTVYRPDLPGDKAGSPDLASEVFSDTDAGLDRPDDIQIDVEDVSGDLSDISDSLTDIQTDAELVDIGFDDNATDQDSDAVEIVVEPPPDLVENWPLGAVEKQCGKGLIATLESPSGVLRIMVLRGTHFEMGKQAGCLVGADIGQFFGSLMTYFVAEIEQEAAEMGLDPEQTSELLFSMLNNIWLYMEPFVPQTYLDEFAGFEEAVLADDDIAQYWTTTKPDWAIRALILLSNLSDMNWSGSFEGVLEKLSVGASADLLQYYAEEDIALLMNRFFRRPGPKHPLPLRTTCSFFAAWGPRTVEGHLLASRNLDWSTDTGISVMKGITFFVPDDGAAHAVIGYLGLFGALAGMSEHGIVVSEVGSESAMERLTGQPWTLKFREILESAENLDQAVQLAAGLADDGQLRPPTIGYNWMVGDGDPPLGTNAAAAAVESNGLAIGVMAGDALCGQQTTLIRYNLEGAVDDVVTNLDDPIAANLEAGALEIDGDGIPRTFAVDDDSGTVVLKENGCPAVEVAQSEGMPFAVGKPIDCALFRGDEALIHGIRRWQFASNGPQQGNDKLLCDSGSYRHRYLVMRDMLWAYATGTSYSHEGEEVISGTGDLVPVGLPEAEQIARAAAMGSNVMSIAYDATARAIRISYEIGSADSWEAAHKHAYTELDLGAAFDLLAQQID